MQKVAAFGNLTFILRTFGMVVYKNKTYRTQVFLGVEDIIVLPPSSNIKDVQFD